MTANKRINTDAASPRWLRAKRYVCERAIGSREPG